MPANDPAVFLAARRTRLSFQRTRMSADRTLMSIIRTALSLIGFGFTIFQFFRTLRESVNPAIRPGAARNFGLTLVLLGVLLLTFGIVGHVRFMLELRRDHAELADESLIPHDRFPLSVTLVGALLLLLTGIVAILSMVGRSGPFH
jgi:putative membrane protein